MVNFDLNICSLLGTLDILLAFGLPVIPLFVPNIHKDIIGVLGVKLYRIEVFVLFFNFFLVGFILMFQGWRLDPVLLFAVLLLHLTIIFLVCKDIIVFAKITQKNRHR